MIWIEIEHLKAMFETLETRLNSVRSAKYRAAKSEPENDSGELERLRAAFGGSLPVELSHLEKYKNDETL